MHRLVRPSFFAFRLLSTRPHTQRFKEIRVYPKIRVLDFGFLSEPVDLNLAIAC